MYYSDEHCRKCNKITGHSDGKCIECLNREEKEKFDKSLGEFLMLSNEEKLIYLHKKIYDLENNSGWNGFNI